MPRCERVSALWSRYVMAAGSLPRHAEQLLENAWEVNWMRERGNAASPRRRQKKGFLHFSWFTYLVDSPSLLRCHERWEASSSGSLFSANQIIWIPLLFLSCSSWLRYLLTGSRFIPVVWWKTQSIYILNDLNYFTLPFPPLDSAALFWCQQMQRLVLSFLPFLIPQWSHCFWFLLLFGQTHISNLFSCFYCTGSFVWAAAAAASLPPAEPLNSRKC